MRAEIGEIAVPPAGPLVVSLVVSKLTAWGKFFASPFEALTCQTSLWAFALFKSCFFSTSKLKRFPQLRHGARYYGRHFFLFVFSL